MKNSEPIQNTSEKNSERSFSPLLQPVAMGLNKISFCFHNLAIECITFSKGPQNSRGVLGTNSPGRKRNHCLFPTGKDDIGISQQTLFDRTVFLGFPMTLQGR